MCLTAAQPLLVVILMMQMYIQKSRPPNIPQPFNLFLYIHKSKKTNKPETKKRTPAPLVPGHLDSVYESCLPFPSQYFYPPRREASSCTYVILHLLSVSTGTLHVAYWMPCRIKHHVLNHRDFIAQSKPFVTFAPISTMVDRAQSPFKHHVVICFRELVGRLRSPLSFFTTNNRDKKTRY